jgi:hypothetical protein
MVRQNVARNSAPTCLLLGYPEWSANAVVERPHDSFRTFIHVNEHTNA